MYHQTTAKAKKAILKDGFNSLEVWLAPDDTADYGKATIEVYAPKPKHPFVMDYYSGKQYSISEKQIDANREYYNSLGGEANPNTFITLRSNGFDVIIEDNGDRCYLFPKQIKPIN